VQVKESSRPSKVLISRERGLRQPRKFHESETACFGRSFAPSSGAFSDRVLACGSRAGKCSGVCRARALVDSCKGGNDHWHRYWRRSDRGGLAGVSSAFARRHQSETRGAAWTTLAWCVFTAKAVAATFLPLAGWSMILCVTLDLFGCALLIQGVYFGTRQVYQQLEEE
jgi:hypothetical protein